VRLYPATRSRDVRFNQLHAPDGSRIRQRRVCEVEDKEVAADEIVKGYEIAKGRYVTLTDEELEAMKPESSHSVELEEFVHEDEIDPIQLERSYWLGPDRDSAARPFALFQRALAEEKLVGIGRIVLGTKEQLVCVRPVGDGLALTTLFYADEVTPEHEIERTEAEVGEKELNVARQLVTSLVTKWDPKEHRDTYRDRLLQMIEAKAAGESVEVPKPSAPREAPADLLAALEASLAAAKDRATGMSKPKANGLKMERHARKRLNLPVRIVVRRANVEMTNHEIPTAHKANVRSLAMAASIRKVSIHAMIVGSKPAVPLAKPMVMVNPATTVRRAAVLLVNGLAVKPLHKATANAAATRVRSTTVHVLSAIMGSRPMHLLYRPRRYAVSVRCHRPINVSSLC
jgi:DNA end-binding protein Ku